MPLTFYYPDTPQLPLPDGHRFPAGKYVMLQQLLVNNATVRPEQFATSPIATREQLTTSHDPAYVDAIADGSIDPKIMKRIGLPWSKTHARRARATVGGTLAAARDALEHGFGAQLAGGTHHAHFSEGAGFCTFNDFAVTATILFEEQKIRRVAIIDVDVHQGDGNATLLGPDPRALVVSIHGARNWPFDKAQSDLDIPLDDGTEDDAYLHALDDALSAIASFQPDLLLINGGVDPLAEDRLGRLALTFEGLAKRDRTIFAFAKSRGIPAVLAIGGGYAEPIDLSVRAYGNTFEAAKSVYGF
ncbi:MAG: histone deacetylase [Pseudomonadota bacterium]